MFRLYDDLYGWNPSKVFVLILPFAYVNQVMHTHDLYPIDAYYIAHLSDQQYEVAIERYYRKRHEEKSNV